MDKYKRRIAFLIIFLLFSLLSYGETDTIKVGTFLPLTGPVSPIGLGVLHGMKAYFNMINAEFGVHGKNIKLIAENDAFNPSRTILAVKKLVRQDKVIAIIGGTGTPGCLSVIDFLENEKVPFIYPISGSSKLAEQFRKYIFVVQPNYYLEGQIMVKFIKEHLNLHRIGCIYSNDDIGLEGFQGVKLGIKKFGGELVAEVPFSITETDFTSHVMKLKQAKPDVVIIIAVLKPTASILKTAYSLGLKSKFITSYINADPVNFITLAGEDAANGVYLGAWLDLADASNPGVVKFFSMMKKYFPNEKNIAYAAAGWIAAEIFTEALKRCGSDISRERLVNVLENLNSLDTSLVKNISYSKDSRTGVTSMYFLQVRGKFMVRSSPWISLK